MEEHVQIMQVREDCEIREENRERKKWGCGAAIGDDPSEARLAVILDSEEGSHVDFWEKNLSTGNI